MQNEWFQMTYRYVREAKACIGLAFGKSFSKSIVLLSGKVGERSGKSIRGKK